MPDVWLEVSIRKVLRPAISTQVFLFPCVYKQTLRWFPTFQVATTCFSCSPPDLNLAVTNFMFSVNVKYPLPPGDNPIAVIIIIIIIITKYLDVHTIMSLSLQLTS